MFDHSVSTFLNYIHWRSIQGGQGHSPFALLPYAAVGGKGLLLVWGINKFFGGGGGRTFCGRGSTFCVGTG